MANLKRKGSGVPGKYKRYIRQYSRFRGVGFYIENPLRGILSKIQLKSRGNELDSEKCFLDLTTVT